MPQHDALETLRTDLRYQQTLLSHGDTETIRSRAAAEIHRLERKIRQLEGTDVPQS